MNLERMRSSWRASAFTRSWYTTPSTAKREARDDWGPITEGQITVAVSGPVGGEGGGGWGGLIYCFAVI